MKIVTSGVITITSAEQAKELCGEGSPEHGLMEYYKRIAPPVLAMGVPTCERCGKPMPANGCLCGGKFGVQLSDFTAAIEKHLVPLLPGRLRVVTDRCDGFATEPVFVAYVLEADGGELAHLFHEPTGAEFNENQAREVARDIAAVLMEREARDK